MDFRFFAILILTYSLINETLQDCSTKESRRYEMRPYFIVIHQKYVYCESTDLSDFHKQVASLVKNQALNYIEIMNTTSTEIPSRTFSDDLFINLPELKINNGNIRVINQDAFDGLWKLQKLSLRNNKIISVNEKCLNLTNLEVLDLSFNSIADINENAFVNLTKVKILLLQNNFITTLPPTLFQNVINVEQLDLSFNKLTSLDNNLFKNLTTLTQLLLNNNKLNYFSGKLLPHTSKLETLLLNNNILLKLNDLSFENTKLLLNVSNNLIQILNFTKFSQFEIIDLSSNGISSIKQEFFNNFAVKQLNLTQNYLGLNPIPKTLFSNFSVLERLSLSDNQIKRLDKDMFIKNSVLSILDLSKNELSQTDLKFPTSISELMLSNNNFDSTINVTTLINLTVLDLSHNNLQYISFHFLEKLKLLRFLKLNNNKINKIDTGAFRDLKFLSKLDLSYNNISNLNLGVFVGMEDLFDLDISHNKLNELKEGIFHGLKDLKYLNIGYNNISFFSVENTLAHFSFLRGVDLGGNNWPCSFLTNIIREFKATSFKAGHDVNVTNVNGIACRYEPVPSPGVVDLEKNLNEVSSKLTTNNSLLTCIVIIFIVCFVLQYLIPYFKRRRLIPVRTVRTEEDMHQML